MRPSASTADIRPIKKTTALHNILMRLTMIANARGRRERQAGRGIVRCRPIVIRATCLMSSVNSDRNVLIGVSGPDSMSGPIAVNAEPACQCAVVSAVTKACYKHTHVVRRLSLCVCPLLTVFS